MKIRVGVIGGAGYTGGELLRILVHHPAVEITFVHSNSNSGNYLYKVHSDLLGITDLRFCDTLSQEINVLFLCTGHGDSLKFLHSNTFNSNVKIIDLSQDFRLVKQGNDFVYGLPELQKETIQKSSKIANPGCFATCIQLALLPLAQAAMLNHEIHISAITGSTGAGQSLTETSHFSWRTNNLSVYKVFEHQHLKEIKQSIVQLQNGFSADINFVPFRGDFSRGIFATLYTHSDLTIEQAKQLYQSYYQNAPFTHVSESNPHLKQVVNTNNAILYLEKHGNKLFIVSMIDNLLKGASGQAVQNMNLIFGLEETTGLRFKANFF
jgi:N-acetyl-gamma-glutamyl-phosphate reductase